MTKEQLDELSRWHVAYEVAAEYGGAVESCAAQLSAAVGRLLLTNGRGGSPVPNEFWKGGVR